MSLPARTSPLLGQIPHGFYGRAGGVSEGIYAGLNAGPGSGDDPAAVAENRNRIRDHLGAEHLVTGYQTHSTIAAFLDEPPTEQVRADALVTATPGLAIGVLAADCVPVLFAGDCLIGAAHAGWRGSLDGILEATIALMAEKGAGADSLSAAIGPCLRAPAFEVGDDLIDEVTGKYPVAERFFSPGERPGKSIYDHVSFVRWRLTESGIDEARIGDTGGCTLTTPEDWFSYRASRANGDADYGRNISVIALSTG
ncbi:peptidoglycan editing factor PgeF [Parvularcula marina]|uniref:peptidoglycan editing factor PgeF n=1 Tax=Parvularcula marina TaxID=2292771 RepID=UPI0018F47662|nr:peptidoglycan editing factor PgeF [Parvularcula marina]